MTTTSPPLRPDRRDLLGPVRDRVRAGLVGLVTALVVGAVLGAAVGEVLVTLLRLVLHQFDSGTP